MSFISFNLNYYKSKIEYFENRVLTKSDIYEAKQLLKVIDDLTDEGYYDLFNALQNEFKGVDRLRTVITTAGEKPFKITSNSSSFESFKHGKTELTEYIDKLILKSKSAPSLSDDDFLKEIKNYCKSINYDKNSAYIFLLRDTLLPYMHFKTTYTKNIFAWLISRSFFNLTYGNENTDDIIRAPIIDALENGCDNFEAFSSFCKKEILNKLRAYPKIISTLKSMLSEIKSEKIVVIETGCYGTFPMLLSALDERVTFKMYSTVPCLFEIYKNHIFTTAYEYIRKFETLTCNDKLFRLSDFKENKFYVSENESDEILVKSLNEIACFLKK